VIRLRGTQSILILNKWFPSKNLEAQATHTIHVGLIKEGDAVLDEVVVSL
jgi:tRNA modification GTPase